MPNWDHLKCHFYQNLVNAAVEVCLQDSSVSNMPSREELCKRVKDYLEGIAKMKNRLKAERDANRLLKTIRARVNPLSAWIKTNLESTSPPLQGEGTHPDCPRPRDPKVPLGRPHGGVRTWLVNKSQLTQLAKR